MFTHNILFCRSFTTWTSLGWPSLQIAEWLYIKIILKCFYTKRYFIGGFFHHSKQMTCFMADITFNNYKLKLATYSKVITYVFSMHQILFLPIHQMVCCQLYILFTTYLFLQITWESLSRCPKSRSDNERLAFEIWKSEGKEKLLFYDGAFKHRYEQVADMMLQWFPELISVNHPLQC